MKRYFIKSAHHALPSDAEPIATLKQARKELGIWARELKAQARARGWKKAAIIACGEVRHIHACADRDSPLWASISIVQG